MTQTLHITNGDSTGDMLRSIPAITGDKLIWRDILHEGPVPNKPMIEIDEVRAKFLSQYTQIPSSDIISADFKKRRDTLNKSDQYDEIILWFEHDLYDQLQLIQVLDFYASSPAKAKLSLICIDHFDGVEPFYGLGNLTPEQLGSLIDQKKTVTDEMYSLAQESWKAFTDTTPVALYKITKNDCSALPFLKKSLVRFLQEYPSHQNGLTKSENLILQAIAKPLKEFPRFKNTSADEHYQDVLKSDTDFRRIFLSLQELEEHPFMGDLTVMSLLDRLSSGKKPLLLRVGDNYQLTPDGQKSYDKKQFQLTGRRWFGGTQLSRSNIWFWNDATKSITQKIAA